MLQLSSVVVALDGSSFAEQALPLAAQLAKRSSATLRLVLVHSPASAWDPGVEFSLFDPEVERQVREREYAYLESIAARLVREGEMHVECILLNGPTAESLEAYVERTGTDLVVMTSHGRGGIGRMVLGNVADQLVHRLHVPVLIIRPEDKKTRPVTARRHRILVPLDGSALATSILDQAAAFARLTDSDLLLVSVVQPMAMWVPPLASLAAVLTEAKAQREHATGQYLENVEKQLRSEGLVVTSIVRESFKVAKEILRLAREHQCELIAMATHGASGLDRLILGSVADQVMRHAEIPVLLLRPAIVEEAIGAGTCQIPALAAT